MQGVQNPTAQFTQAWRNRIEDDGFGLMGSRADLIAHAGATANHTMNHESKRYIHIHIITSHATDNNCFATDQCIQRQIWARLGLYI